MLGTINRAGKGFRLDELQQVRACSEHGNVTVSLRSAEPGIWHGGRGMVLLSIAVARMASPRRHATHLLELTRLCQSMTLRAGVDVEGRRQVARSCISCQKLRAAARFIRRPRPGLGLANLARMLDLSCHGLVC